MSLFPLSVLPQDNSVWYYPNFIPRSLAQHYYTILSQTLNWEQHPIRLFGKTMLQPRLIAWHGTPNITYKYAQTVLTAEGWTPELKALQEQLLEKGLRFNAVLANWYRDGQDSMSWHSDNEKELGTQPCIASISLGAARQLHFRSIRKPRQRASILLEEGSLLVMKGKCQEYWQHQLPKSKRITTGRINLTFRQIIVE